MKSLTFTGLGTHWEVLVDSADFSDDAKNAILEYVEKFENRFSRFLMHSEANAFRNSSAGEYPVSEEFARLLAVAEKLRKLTDSTYDPAVGGLLERAGYGVQGAEGSRGTVEDFSVPQWSLSGERLTIDGPIAFDFGGIGKGYCIDQVAGILERFGYGQYLADGGGDMMATTKADGSAWRVAVEYPGKPDIAASVVDLSHQGLAVSDSCRRRFGKWHHLVDVREKKAIQPVVGCAAVAENAWMADCMTSGLFFAKPENYPLLAQAFKASYLVFRSDSTVQASPDWQGELL